MIFLVPNKKILWAKLIALFLFWLLLLPLIPTSIQAQDQPSEPTTEQHSGAQQGALYIFEETAKEAQLTNSPNIYQIIGIIVNIILGFVGVIFLVLIIYGGIKWMTVGASWSEGLGDYKKIHHAKTIIIQATFGLIIVLAAFLLTNFVVAKLILGIWMD